MVRFLWNPTVRTALKLVSCPSFLAVYQVFDFFLCDRDRHFETPSRRALQLLKSATLSRKWPDSLMVPAFLGNGIDGRD